MYRTKQEEFWAGEFGNTYIGRNSSEEGIAASTNLFSKILEKTAGVSDVLEIGPNIGLNMHAIKRLKPSSRLTGLEINQEACKILAEYPYIEAINESVLSYNTERKWDLVFTRGVLIHINPDEMTTVYDKMYNFSKRYIVVAEYYNPTPVKVNYRGHEDRLFKRDFAGELMDRFKDLTLIDYGFIYHRDNNFPQDDITWFLLEKKR